MNMRVNESISWSIFNATTTGNGKIIGTGNGFNKIIGPDNGFTCSNVVIHIFPSKQKRGILFEATRTCIWLKLDVSSMCVRFATQPRLK